MTTNQSIIALLRLIAPNDTNLLGQVIRQTASQEDAVVLSQQQLLLIQDKVELWRNEVLRPLIAAINDIEDPINTHIHNSTSQRDNYFVLIDQVEHLRELNDETTSEFTKKMLNDTKQTTTLEKSWQSIQKLVNAHQLRELQKVQDQQRYQVLARDLRKYGLMLALSSIVTAANKMIGDYAPTLVSITTMIPFVAYGVGLFDKIDHVVPTAAKELTVATTESGKKATECLYIARNLWNLYQILPVARLLLTPLRAINPLNVIMAPFRVGQAVRSSLDTLITTATSGCMITRCATEHYEPSHQLQETVHKVSTYLTNHHADDICVSQFQSAS